MHEKQDEVNQKLLQNRGKYIDYLLLYIHTYIHVCMYISVRVSVLDFFFGFKALIVNMQAHKYFVYTYIYLCMYVCINRIDAVGGFCLNFSSNSQKSTNRTNDFVIASLIR